VSRAPEPERPFDPCASPRVAAYVSGIRGAGPAVEDADPSRPFIPGRSIFRTLEQIFDWRYGGFASVGSLLDSASGYGRTTRFLVCAMPARRITVAEIDPEAVRFQRETFGVGGACCGSDPASLVIERQFDADLASSFFSHLPAASFEAWLRRLGGLVAPGGVLIFSVHGMHLLPAAEVDHAAGIVFRPVSETTRLDVEEYGTSYVTPEFVRAVARRATNGDGPLLEFRSGLAGLQDLYVLTRSGAPPLRNLRLDRVPLGALDHSAMDSGVVSIEGWAEGDADERPPDMRLFFGETVAGFSPGEGGHGTRRRWSFAFSADSISPDEVVRVEAESERGRSGILAIGTLRPYLPGPGP
jgi:SAM-dependent methyltransferase